MEFKWTVANILTVIRLGLVPFFVLFLCLKMYSVSLVIFAVASFTDLIDGTIARIRHEFSQMGALLDPLADKLLMMTAFVSFAILDVTQVWIATALVARDVMIVGGYFYLTKYRKISFIPKPIWTSKFATLFEIVAGILALIYLINNYVQIGDYPLGDFLDAFMVVSGILIVISGIQYVVIGIELLQSHPRHEVASKAGIDTPADDNNSQPS